eukprot:Platyproteum_vivax@DN7673_c1_g2_i23.p1
MHGVSSQDLGQFNQTQLRELLENHYNDQKLLKTQEEFLCYRLVYLTLQKMQLDLLGSLEQLSGEEMVWQSVKWALQVREAVHMGNYVRYFKLAKTARHK